MKSKIINKQTLFLCSLLFILVFSSLMYMPVVADESGDEDDDGIPDDNEAQNERLLEIEVSDYEAHL